MIKKLFRKLRGIVGTGLTWAVGWAGVTLALNVLTGIPFHFVGQVALSGLVRGFIAGGAFATILSIAERRHTLQDLSLRRVALWGGIGGSVLFFMALPVLMRIGVPMGTLLGPLVINTVLGAGFASGSVALARRADTKLLGDDSYAGFLEDGE